MSPLHVTMLGVGGFLLLATLVGTVLHARRRSDTTRNLMARILAWWAICAAVFGCLAWGTTATIVLFALVSFHGLREMVTLSRTRRADHHTLFWAFFVALPLQYVFVGIGWYGMFTIFIPVWCFVFLAIRSAAAGDTTAYLERTAKIQWALFLCVYCIAHLPALLQLRLAVPGWRGDNVALLLFVLLIAQLSDVFQYIWGKLLGRRPIVPSISPHKTWAGLLLGLASVTVLGLGLAPMTPFTWWQAMLMALLIAVLGFFGGLVMSAIKRDVGIKDFGSSLAGHGGILDRVDSLIFSAPIYFHVLHFYFCEGGNWGVAG